jgi:hypothetical protein
MPGLLIWTSNSKFFLYVNYDRDGDVLAMFINSESIIENCSRMEIVYLWSA